MKQARRRAVRNRPPAGGWPGRSGRLVIMQALAALPGLAPSVDDLAAALGRPMAEMAEVVAYLERMGVAEAWEDPPGPDRIMLSADSAEALGLVPDFARDRWTDPPRSPR